MRLAIFAIFLQKIASCYAGRFWTKNFGSQATQQVLAKPPDPMQQIQELDALLTAQASWAHHDRKSDCFRVVAGSVRSQCAQLDMNESERVSAAISMTLCELATAKHHSIPFECASFSLDTGEKHPSTSVHMQGECVDALSRSAQFWSSYSGYLREIPQLCFAFRRWHDIDTARDIYRNATLDQATLIRHIVSREKAAEINLRTWEGHFEHLQQAIFRIHSAVGDIYASREQLGSLLEKTSNEIENVVTALVKELREERQYNNLRLSDQFFHAFDELYQRHASRLHAVVPSLELAVAKHLDIVAEQFSARNLEFVNMAAHVQQQWITIGIGMDNLSGSIGFLTATATEIAHVFNDCIQQAQLLSQIQQEGSNSATDLVSALSSLTSTAHTELEKMNNASIAMTQQRLFYTDMDGFSWIISGLMRVVKILLRVDCSFLGYFSHPACIRVILPVLGFIGFLFRMFLSTVMTIGIFFLSARRYINIGLVQGVQPNRSSSSTPAQLDPAPTHAFSLQRRSLRTQPFSRIDPCPQSLCYSDPRRSRIPEHLRRPIH